MLQKKPCASISCNSRKRIGAKTIRALLAKGSGALRIAAALPGHPFRSSQRVAIDDRAGVSRNIIEDAALDQRVRSCVTEEDERRSIVVTARVSGDLPTLGEEPLDRQRRFGGRDRRGEENRREA